MDSDARGQYSVRKLPAASSKQISHRSAVPHHCLVTPYHSHITPITPPHYPALPGCPCRLVQPLGAAPSVLHASWECFCGGKPVSILPSHIYLQMLPLLRFSSHYSRFPHSHDLFNFLRRFIPNLHASTHTYHITRLDTNMRDAFPTILALPASVILLFAITSSRAGSVIKGRKHPLNIDWDPAPSPETGAPLSAGALRDKAYLPAEIGGIVGAYTLVVVLLFITLFLAGRQIGRAHV